MCACVWLSRSVLCKAYAFPDTPASLAASCLAVTKSLIDSQTRTTRARERERERDWYKACTRHHGSQQEKEIRISFPFPSAPATANTDAAAVAGNRWCFRSSSSASERERETGCMCSHMHVHGQQQRRRLEQSSHKQVRLHETLSPLSMKSCLSPRCMSVSAALIAFFAHSLLRVHTQPAKECMQRKAETTRRRRPSNGRRKHVHEQEQQQKS